MLQQKQSTKQNKIKVHMYNILILKLRNNFHDLRVIRERCK